MSSNIKLTKCQQRIVATLYALTKSHDWQWWPRYTIGEVIDAGGWHQSIQVGTMRRLKELGVVQTERSSWPANTRQMVRCSCASCCWGLTLVGMELAKKLKVHWSAEQKGKVAAAGCEARACERDEDEFGQYRRRDDDDDDDPPVGPRSPVPLSGFEK